MMYSKSNLYIFFHVFDQFIKVAERKAFKSAPTRPLSRGAATPLPRNAAAPLPRNAAKPLPRNAAAPLQQYAAPFSNAPPLIIHPATATEPRSVFPSTAAAANPRPPFPSAPVRPLPQPTMPAALLPRLPAPTRPLPSASLPPFHSNRVVEEKTVEEEIIMYGRSLRTREKDLKTRRVDLLEELRSVDRALADNKLDIEKFDVMARKSGLSLPVPEEPAFKLQRITFTPPDPRQSVADLVRCRPKINLETYKGRNAASTTALDSVDTRVVEVAVKDT